MSALDLILSSLSATYGEGELRTACLRFAASGPIKGAGKVGAAGLPLLPASSSSSPHESDAESVSSKKKKESKPRGPSKWNLMVAEVLKEMREAWRAENPDAPEGAENKAVIHKMAFEEAGRRKRENDPEAQAKYEKSQEKKAEKKAEKEAAKASSGK